MSDVRVDPGAIGEIDIAAPAEPKAERNPRDWPFPADRDWLLAHLVERAAFGLEFGLTLSVKGTIVAGTVISGATFMREQAEILKGATYSGAATAETVTLMSDLYAGFAPVYERPNDAPEDYRAPPPNYLHMRDVTFLSAQGGTFDTGSALWRFRIQEVDGFTMGAVRPTR